MRKKPILTTLLSMAIIMMTAFSMYGELTATKLRHGSETPKDMSPKIAAAYVMDWGKRDIDPFLFTHIIYAFAEFNDACDGVTVKNRERLQAVADLKKQNPDLKVMLGVGGDKREGFSEMAGDKKKRKAFIRELKHYMDSLNLDGFDFDWEFPTTTDGGHTATPQDDSNYVKLVKELRKAIGKDKWISYYSNNSGRFIDHKKMAPYVSYVNVSGYNLALPKEGKPGGHQCPLYPSKKFGEWCVSKSIARHIDLGVPREKILMGIPYFGRGRDPLPTILEYRLFVYNTGKLPLMWDEEAQVPYYADEKGEIVMGFDDERSIGSKFDFVRANELPGVFVFPYEGDDPAMPLSKRVKELRK